jgi:ketosteroid isomerase-like protein
MPRILLSMLLAGSLVGFVKAREITGDKAEEAKKEIAKIEQGKLITLRNNGPDAADWFHRYDDDDLVMTVRDGSTETKAEHEPKLRFNQVAIVSMKQYDHRVRVFGNGDVAVVTYKQIGQLEGQAHPSEGVTTDVWVKEDGGWQRVVHNVHQVVKK